jgi:N-acetylmuramoyl-L-alanine amidase
MKLVGYFSAGALVVGIVAFNMTDRVEASLRVAPHVVFAPEPAPEPSPAVATDPSPAAQRVSALPTRVVPTPTAENRRGRGGNNRRQRGFRSRNRYPGPIPTPADWAPPEGPVRIALQAGHWKANEAPAELSGLKDNGTHGGGKAEWEVNLAIARSAAAMLEQKGYEVDILPAVVPPGYRAHLFIAIHADGAADPRASGYRVAAPGRDATGRASRMVSLLEESYGKATGLRRLPDVTRRMESYYAFNFRRYEHALHPMTIGVIIETGFLTSASDRALIVNDPERVARGIVDAVVAFPETPAPAAGG